MYLCICKAVTESQVQRCVANGATTLKDVVRTTGLGTGCGKCVPTAYEFLRDDLDDRRSPAAHQAVATRTR